MSIFDKWNKAIDVDGLKKDINEADQGNKGDYEEVPYGQYECKVEKMEIKESKKGDPMFVCWFRILEGKYKNSVIFRNQVINQGFQISIVKKFLKSLEALDESEITFEDYSQFNDLIMDIHEAVDGKLEYLIDYGEKKGYSTFTVKEVFEV